MNTPANAASAVLSEKNHSSGNAMLMRCKRAVLFIPLFLYVFLAYIVIETTVADVRAVVFQIGPYAVSWVEIIYFLSSMAAMMELLRVSKPGIDNTVEALRMLGISVVFIILFVWAIARGSAAFAIFNNTEFMILTFLSVTQVVLAFIFNARTLKRTIDYSGGEH